MITHLTPKLMSPMPNTTHHQNSNNNNNNFNFQDYFSQPGPQLAQTPSQQQQNENENNGLEDDLTQIPMPPTVLQSGLTPYMTDDPSLLTNDLNNGPTYDISTPQIEELSELNELNQLKQQLNPKRKSSSDGNNNANHDDDDDNLNGSSYKRQKR